MKRCKNCWTDNPDTAERCQKCGRSLDETWWKNKKFRLYPQAIISGLLTTAVLFAAGSYLFGISNTFGFGFFPIPFISGCVATVLAYRKEANANNSLLNSLAVGIILSICVIVGTIVAAGLVDASLNPVILIMIFPVIVATLIGGGLGNVINIAMEKGRGSTITIIAILICVIALGGYGAYQLSINGHYENGAYVLSYELDFMDIIQSEADAYLNASYTTPQQRLSNLKNAEVKYERLVNITDAAKPQSDEMIGNSSSSVRQEYADAMGIYLQLRRNYCTEMYHGIRAEINENTAEAQKHYRDAQNLIPQVQSQKDQITTIINKDSSFKQYLAGILNMAKRDVGRHKSENMTFYMG